MLSKKDISEAALALDPAYAQAYSGLAFSYYVMALMGVRPADELKHLAIAAAEKALAIDPSDSESYTVLAVLAGIFDYDWTRAEKHHVKSVTVDQVSPRSELAVKPVNTAWATASSGAPNSEGSPAVLIFTILVINHHLLS